MMDGDVTITGNEDDAEEDDNKESSDNESMNFKSGPKRVFTEVEDAIDIIAGFSRQSDNYDLTFEAIIFCRHFMVVMMKKQRT